MYGYPFAAPIPANLVWAGGFGTGAIVATVGLIMTAVLVGIVVRAQVARRRESRPVLRGVTRDPVTAVPRTRRAAA